MKNLIIISIIFSLSLWACTSVEQQEAEENLSELRVWMDSIYLDDDSLNIQVWQKIETEYTMVKAEVDSTQENLSQESKTEFKELQAAFDTMQMKYKAAIDNTQSEAREEMLKIQAWMDSKAADMKENDEENIAAIGEEWQELESAFSKNLNNLTEETKEEWNTLKNRINQWVEYDLKKELK